MFARKGNYSQDIFEMEVHLQWNCESSARTIPNKAEGKIPEGKLYGIKGKRLLDTEIQ